MNSHNGRTEGQLGDVVTIETAVRLIAGDLERMTDSELVQLLLHIRDVDVSPLVSRVEPLAREELARRRAPIEPPSVVPPVEHVSVNTWHG